MLIAQCDGPTLTEAADQLAACCSRAGASYVAVSSDETESVQLLELRRLAYPALERLGVCLVEDVCVPISALAAMIRRIEGAAATHGVMIATVAHSGDGNLHPTFIYDRSLEDPPASVWAAADEVFAGAIGFGGTLTGEHGVGALKGRWLDLELGTDTRDVHRGIKAALDPLGLLNPGRGI